MDNYLDKYWHIPLHEEGTQNPLGMLNESPSIIGIKEHQKQETYCPLAQQCNNFKLAPKGTIVLLSQGNTAIVLCEIADDKVIYSSELKAKYGYEIYRNVEVIEYISKENQLQDDLFVEEDEIFWYVEQSSSNEKNVAKYNYIDEIISRIKNNSLPQRDISLLKEKKNIILQGAPGTGKTYTTASIAVGICSKEFIDFDDHAEVMAEYERLQNDGRIAFCTFHQSMDYEDFVEGMKPRVEENIVRYEIESGIFKTICEEAKQEENKEKDYVLIIDEINRGNISKVFGELITLLEADKRSNGGSHEIKVKLPYSKDEFSVPSNLYIIGTMNTTDRSTGMIDYAVRRRFAFVTLEASIDVIKKSTTGEVCDAALALFEEINGKSKYDEESFIAKHKSIDFELEDLKVGHSYFMAKDMDTLKMKMQYEVVPLIKEYIKDGILKSGEQNEAYFEKWINAECFASKSVDEQEES